jgi:hypothetical protein
VRIVVPTHDIRKVKSDIAREVLAAFQAQGISVASGTYAIVQVPPLRVALDGDATAYPSEPAEVRSGGRRPRRARGEAPG